MIRILLFLLISSGLPLAVGQNLKPAVLTSPNGCRTIKPAEYLDRYYVCGPNPARADILQISYGEAGPKIHIFTSKAAWTQHFGSIEHRNCSDFQVAAGSKEDRLIQKHLRKYIK